MMKSLFRLFLIALLCMAAAFAQVVPTPPTQPTFGPGGSDYLYDVVVNGPYWANNRTVDDSMKYYIYEPCVPATCATPTVNPTPASAPVILFLHGFAAFNTSNYDAWLRHMARKGYIVVWAQYQKSLLTSLSSLTPNARSAYSDALNRLENFWWEHHVKPQKDANGKILSTFVGHSLGAWIAAVIASEATSMQPQVPVPLALTLIEPGTKGLIPGTDFSKMDQSTKYTVLIGDFDRVACKAQALEIWDGTPQVTNKDFLVARTDLHGKPYQLASHFFPNTDGYNDTAPIDGRDFFITWKLSVAAASCVTTGSFCDYAFGGVKGSNQLDRGFWSDGVPVIPLTHPADPTTLPQIPGCKK
jgi:pimeloyl-ACP methyl ester carboxylesterase